MSVLSLPSKNLDLQMRNVYPKISFFYYVFCWKRYESTGFECARFKIVLSKTIRRNLLLPFKIM